MAETASEATMPTSFTGINHVKLPCTSFRKTHDFYTTIFPFIPLPQYNHYTPNHKLFAMMFEHASTNLLVEVRYAPGQAAAQKGWDPITFGVSRSSDLEEWGTWFDRQGVRRSRVLTGVKGWVMGCEDPDGRIVRLYVEDEEHEWTDHPDQDEYWLGSVVGDAEAEEEGEE